ncbi:MAG: methyl-accepting chemotaxis protein, partial [Ectothiorhodospiraceae bacterium]
MTMPRGMSIRLKLTVPVSVLAVFLLATMCWHILRTYSPEATKASGFGRANAMADLILGAAAEEAKERGFTVAYLSTLRKGTRDTAARSTIDNLRNAGDQQMSKALAVARALVADGWGGANFRDQVEATTAALDRVRALRREVDGARVGGRIPQVSEWFGTATDLIQAGAKLREMAFFPADRLERAAFTNTRVKTAIWLASEYAGRERAKLAGAAAKGAPLDAELRSTLKSYRGIVERQLAFLEEALSKLVASTDNEALAADYRQARKDLDDGFLGEFESVRQSMYTASDTGEYPLTKAQWLKQSTAAINTILGLTRVASEAARVDASAVQSTADRSLWGAGVIGLLSLLLGAGVLLLVVRTTGRIRQAEQSITQVAENNDLTLRMRAEGADELSRMGVAFNGMLDRFQEIISAVNAAVSDVVAGATQVAASS